MNLPRMIGSCFQPPIFTVLTAGAKTSWARPSRRAHLYDLIRVELALEQELDLARQMPGQLISGCAAGD